MKAIPIFALCLLAGLGAGGAAAQPTALPNDTTRAPSAAPVPDAGVSPPGIQRLEIRPDTFAEREAFLARRRVEMERQKIETVAPLPAQRIAPSASAVPQQK